MEIKPYEILTVAELSERTGFSEPTLRKWIRSGELRAVKRGNAYYLTGRAVYEFFSGQDNGQGLESSG